MTNVLPFKFKVNLFYLSLLVKSKQPHMSH
nr:MAG TPA: Nse4 C-terminal [Caudoviricetes sp.]